MTGACSVLVVAEFSFSATAGVATAGAAARDTLRCDRVWGLGRRLAERASAAMRVCGATVQWQKSWDCMADDAEAAGAIVDWGMSRRVGVLAVFFFKQKTAYEIQV